MIKYFFKYENLVLVIVYVAKLDLKYYFKKGSYTFFLK